MKSYKIMVPVLLALALAGSVGYLLNGRADTLKEYETLLKQARESVENGVISDGISFYKEALAMNPSVGVYLEVGNVYLDTDDLQGAKKWYEEEFVTQYPNEPKTYEFGLCVNIARENYSDAFSVYHVCVKREAVSEEVEKLAASIAYEYDLSGSYTDVGAFSEANGYAAVKNGDSWGYISKSGKSAIDYAYQSAEVFGEYAAVINLEKEPYFIDSSGTKKITASYFEDSAKTIKEFKSIQGGKVLAYDGKTWNYYNAESYQKLFGGYQEATTISNGVGAVTKDGINWALIGDDGQEITGYDYKQVLADDRGVVCQSERIFTEQDGQFWLIDPKGKKINQQGYDTACAFYEDSLAAVQKKGKWLFVDSAGKEQDLGSFEEARSFSNGLAAVKKKGKWGYIDLKGKEVIDCIFYDAGMFNQNGRAFVKTSKEEWNLLSLYQYLAD